MEDGSYSMKQRITMSNLLSTNVEDITILVAINTNTEQITCSTINTQFKKQATYYYIILYTNKHIQ